MSLTYSDTGIEVPAFAGQTHVGRATWWDRVQMWAFGRLAGLSELTNTNYAGSAGLLRRAGDEDVTESTGRRDRWKNIQLLREMYKGEAKVGNEYVGMITDFHAALQFGQGLRTTVADPRTQQGESTPEVEVWKSFLEFNNFTGEGGIDLGVCGELDGQVLIRIQPDEKANNVRAWVVPLLETRYKIEYKNPWEASRVLLHPNTKDQQEIPPEEFVFIRLRGISNGSYGIPTCARALADVEGLTLAKQDLRKINRIFGSPTPFFQGKGEAAVRRIKTDILGMNWKIGKAFVAESEDKFSLVTLPAGSLETILKEIILRAQGISGTVAIPVHFFGFPDLMSNRAVAESDFEPSIIHGGKAQKRFMGGFEELEVKVLAMLSRLHGRTYDAEKVKTEFPPPRRNLKDAVETWLPVRVAGEITRKTFLTNIGHADPDQEIADLEDEATAQRQANPDIRGQEDRITGIVDAARRFAG